MIEIEKKFRLSEEDEKRITENAEYLGEAVVLDEYFDTDAYSLTTKDIWLRKRDGNFELKVRPPKGRSELADNYEEIENEEKIREIMKLPVKGSFADDLAEAGYQSFCSPKTIRKTYKQGEFTIAIDDVEYPDFRYRLAEIELMADSQEQADEATTRIIAFAKENQLSFEPVRGKVHEYLLRKLPEHFDALARAGVLTGEVIHEGFRR